MRIALLLSLLLSLACGGTPHRGTTVAELDAPEAQRAEFARIFGARDDLEMEHEEEDDGTGEWEVTTSTTMEVELDSNAEILKLEFEIPLSLVPDAVLSAAAALWPGVSLTEAEVVVQNGHLLYEVEADESDGVEREAYFTPAGEIVDEATGLPQVVADAREVPATSGPESDTNEATEDAMNGGPATTTTEVTTE